jgi:hypothetical protein
MDNLTNLLNNLGSSNEFSPETMSKQIEAAKQKAKEERLLPCIPMTFMSPTIAMMQLIAQRYALDEGQDDELEGQIRQTFIGAELYYSSTPLIALKPSKKYIS